MLLGLQLVDSARYWSDLSLAFLLVDSRSDGDPAVAAALEEVMYMLSSSTEQCKAWIAGISWESAAVHSLPFDLQPDEQAAGRLTSMAFLARILTVATQDSDVAAKPLQSLCASGMVPHYIIAAATMVSYWSRLQLTDAFFFRFPRLGSGGHWSNALAAVLQSLSVGMNFLRYGQVLLTGLVSMQDGWTLPIFRGFIRLLWTSCELYRTCPQILRQVCLLLQQQGLQRLLLYPMVTGSLECFCTQLA